MMIGGSKLGLFESCLVFNGINTRSINSCTLFSSIHASCWQAYLLSFGYVANYHDGILFHGAPFMMRKVGKILPLPVTVAARVTCFVSLIDSFTWIFLCLSHPVSCWSDRRMALLSAFWGHHYEKTAMHFNFHHGNEVLTAATASKKVFVQCVLHFVE